MFSRGKLKLSEKCFDKNYLVQSGAFMSCKLYFYRSNYISFFFFSFLRSFVQRGKNIFGRKLNVITEKRSVSCSLYIK